MRGRVDQQRKVGVQAARGKAANGKRLRAASEIRRTQFRSPKSAASKKRASAAKKLLRNPKHVASKGSMAHKTKRSFATNNFLTGTRTAALMQGPCKYTQETMANNLMRCLGNLKHRCARWRQYLESRILFLLCPCGFLSKFG